MRKTDAGDDFGQRAVLTREILALPQRREALSNQIALPAVANEGKRIPTDSRVGCVKRTTNSGRAKMVRFTHPTPYARGQTPRYR